MNAATGQILWQYNVDRYGGDPFKNFALANDSIFTTTYTDDNERNHPGMLDPKSAKRSVCALQASNGRQLWCSPLAESGNAGIAVEGEVYVWTATYEENWATVPKVTLSTLNPLTGSLERQQPLGSLEVRKSEPLFTVSRRVLFFTINSARENDYTQHLLAINAKTGSLDWKVTFPVPVWGMWEQNAVLYAGYDSGINLRAIRTGNGSQIWQYTTPSQYQPSVPGPHSFEQDEHSFYILTFVGTSPSLMAIARDTGRPLWQDSGCLNPPGSSIIATPLPHPKPVQPGRCYWGDQVTQPAQLLGLVTL
ncbi:hypothetical protein KSX_88090 [Ktedonospora formicarum]|uniref:Pyrrolo-quinoline quinone repeat domain-containing protein n=1 Tax=Ktedonospora formicarum TaxID=2778364 RepID=A0A8J3I8L8_9CHLR|nr:hypothetical protein KSX_88090 [Ktedonospora formicarum]